MMTGPGSPGVPTAGLAGGGGAARPAGPAVAAAGNGVHVRSEFVIFFTWQEPTPSDLLRGAE
jgi:hypothetical protein